MIKLFGITWRPSLLRSATISFSIVALVTMVSQIALVVLKYGLSREALVTSGTEHQAEQLASHLKVALDGGITLDLPPSMAAQFRRYPRDYGFVAIAGNGSVINAANPDLLSDFPFLPSWNLDMSSQTLQRPGGRSTLVTQRHVFAGTEVFIRVTLGRDPAGLRWWLMQDEILDHVIVPMVPLTLAMLVANIFALRRSLRPLAEAARHAEAIDAKSTGLRLETTNLPMEIVPLVRSINDALTRLDRLVSFQRDFTATVAHELRTPLAVLTLQLGQGTQEGSEAGKVVVAEMSHLVNQLLNVAQLEARASVAHEPVNLSVIAREVISRLVPLALDRGREIAFDDVSGDNPAAMEISGHRDAIAAALRNLIENALRATPSGSVVVVSCGPGARLSVFDRGPGVPAALKNTLFAAFTQANPQGGGAGLGLAIVAKTMELHGGRVWFENRPDGCVFHLHFTPRRVKSSQLAERAFF